MLPLRRRTTFSPPPTPFERQLVPVLSTMLASLVPVLPFVASEPLLPPFGLLAFLGWRLLRGDIWPLWVGLPLGLWDDLFSGQPLGTAASGWTAIMLLLDALDRRLPWRSHRQDWTIAAVAIAGHQLFALMIARESGGTTNPLLLGPQLALSALLYPLVARQCAALERWRHAPGPVRR